MSRIVDILQAIQTGTAYTEEAQSRAEAILKSIANNTANPVDIPRSRYEEILSAIKAGTTTTLTAQTRLESLLIAIVNGTLDTWLVGMNLFDESKWTAREINDNKDCLMFNGFFRTTDGIKIGNPLVLANGLKAGTYTVSGKFNKTNYFNALCVLDYENRRTALGEFDSDFQFDSITFTTTDKMQYLYLDTGNSISKGYCEVTTLKFEIGSTATPYTCACFDSELEEEFYKAFR